MDKYIEYAVVIVIVFAFLYQYKVFITPEQLSRRIDSLKHELDKEFVHKDTNDIVIKALKEDMAEIKEKIEKIYDKIMDIK